MAFENRINDESMETENQQSSSFRQQHNYERVLSNDESKGINIHENIQYDNLGQIIAVEYVYEELNEKTNQTQRYHAILRKEEYDQMVQKLNKPFFPFDSFLHIFRPFLMGKFAIEQIPEAFKILDQDKSGYVDLTELSLFIPLIRREASPQLILHYIQKKDSNQDYKLNYDEFSSLILSGIGRDIVVGRL